MTTQSKVAARKAKFPEQYCPRPRCLWHTDGGYCPRHSSVDPEDDPRSNGGCLKHGDYNGREIRCPQCTKEKEGIYAATGS